MTLVSACNRRERERRGAITNPEAGQDGRGGKNYDFSVAPLSKPRQYG